MFAITSNCTVVDMQFIYPVLSKLTDDGGTNCAAGEFDDLGGCEPCPVNTYHKNMTNLCIPCKDGYVTHGDPDTGKNSKDDCASECLLY